MAGAFLRHSILPQLAIELGGGYGSLKGSQYSTVMAMGDLKLVCFPFTGKYMPGVRQRMRPYFYGGVGALRHDPDKTPAISPPGAGDIGWALILPGGVGLELPLLPNVAIDLNAGYSYSFSDDLDAVRTTSRKDAFWHTAVGVVFRGVRQGRDRMPVAALAPPPAALDTDGDGLTDEEERTLTHTNPMLADSDGDGLTDREEIQVWRTDPNKFDTDGGGIGDGAEVARGTNPLDASDDAERTTAAPQQQTPPRRAAGNEAIPSWEVRFGFDTAEITEAARIELDRIVVEMKAQTDLKVDVFGYTDPTGTLAYNRTLSEQRAKAVQDYLVARGIPASRISVQGMGQADPLAGNNQDPKDRRAEIVCR
jgi:outer membrane protein OmpA-like peptidoglycan-associated protein